MSSPSHPFRIIGASLVVWVMIPVTFLGVVGVASDTGPMRPVFGMMALAGVVGVGGAVSTILDALKAGRMEKARELGARSSVAGTPGVDAALARWSIDGGAARAFADAEWATRRIEVVSGAVFLSLAGAAFIWFAEDAEPWAAVATGGFLGGLYLVIGLGKYGLDHANSRRGADRVAVFEDAVSVLGTWHALAGDRQLVGVTFTGDVLELTVRWQTRNGPASDTIRVPVPEEARERAEAAARVLERRVVG